MLSVVYLSLILISMLGVFDNLKIYIYTQLLREKKGNIDKKNETHSKRQNVKMNWLVAHVFTNVIRIFNARRRITFTSNIHDSQQNNAAKVIAHKNGYKYYLSQWE